MEHREIRYDVEDGVSRVTLHRPDRMNAFTARMCGELIDAFDRADEDDGVRAVIVTGAGKAFCAGADLGSGGETFDYTETRDGRGTGSIRVRTSRKEESRKVESGGKRPLREIRWRSSTST